MIDKKKITKRLNKGSKLKEFPLLNFYILVSILFQIIGQGFQISWLQMTKPLPIILMIIYIYSKNTSRDHLMPNLITLGLGFCLIGDLFLMSNENSSFMIGTVFFMIGHILYIMAFKIGQNIKIMRKKYRYMRKFAYLVIICLLGINIYMLWDKFLNNWLFTIYGIILAIQAIVALSRYEHTTRAAFYFTLIGVGLFAISDNLLAFLKFNEIKTDLGRFIIMFTYYGSQYFIMHGALHQSNLKFEIDNYHDKIKRQY